MAGSLDPYAEVFIPGKPWGVPFTEEPAFVQLLKDVLYMLSTNPVAFHEYMSTVTDALNDSITTDSQLEDVAEAIFEQSILEPNFTNTGAKMCEYLVLKLSLPSDIKPFITILNKKAKAIVVDRETLLQYPDTARRVHGTAFFLAELFLMMRNPGDDKSTKVYPYRVALQEIMEALLASPSNDNIKILAKLLKMIGSAMEEFDRENNFENLQKGMGTIFQRIRDIVAEKQIDKGVIYMCVNLLELRASNWGKAAPSSPLPQEHAVAAGGDAPPATFSDAPVFYDTEGKVITSEEASFPSGYPYELDNDFAQQLEEDFEDFIAEDEIGVLEDDFAELVIPDEDSNHYLPTAAGRGGGGGSGGGGGGGGGGGVAVANDQFETFDHETSEAFELFLQESQNKPTFGYSSRNWSHAS